MVDRLSAAAMTTSAVILLAGCFDGSIDVVVNVEDTTDIASYRLVVYEAPNTPPTGLELSGELLTCRDLSFGDIPTDVLEESVVVDLDAAPGDTVSLRDIPRAPEKLFFVEGLNAQGASLIAGCTDIGEIDGPTTVIIDTVGRKSSQITSTVLDESGELGVVRADIVGLDGNPAIADFRGSLRGAGAAGTTFAAAIEGTTDGGGRLTLDLREAPGVEQLQYGPIEAKLRIEWSQAPAVPIGALLLPPAVEATVVGNAAGRSIARGNDLLEVGRIGPGGSLGMVVLATDAPVGNVSQTNAHRFLFESNNNRLVKVGVEPVGQDNVLMGQNRTARTLGLARNVGADKIVTVWEDDSQPAGDELRWTEFIGGNVATKKALFTGIPNKLAATNDCDGGIDTALLAQVLLDRTRLQFAPVSGVGEIVPADLPATFNDSELIAVGCVRDTLGDLRRTLVIDRDGIGGDITSFAPIFAAFVQQPDEEVPLIYTGDASGALAASTSATTAYIGPQSSTSGGTIVLGESTGAGPATSRYLMQLVHDGQEIRVELQGSDPTPAVVVQTAEGDINGDGLGDIVSLVASGITATGITASVHISMAVPDSAERFRAQMPSPLDLNGGRLRLADIDGDGTDDIIVSSADKLRVYLMGQR